MGNTSSTRRVTVVNDDVVGIVQITDSVVRRLKGDEEEKRPRKKTVEVAPVKPPEPEPASSSKMPTARVESFSSSLEQRQKHLEELRNVEISWQNRLKELEKQNSELFDSSQGKFASGIQHVEEKYIHQTFDPVCPEKQSDVLKCYQENRKMPLKCAEEVKEFVQCVDKVRMNILASQG